MNQKPVVSQRSIFLFLLGCVITVALLGVIKGFLLTIVVAAILAAIVHPFYRRFLKALGDRQALASSVTVLLILLVVIIPGMLMLGIIASEAESLSESAKEWVKSQAPDSESLEKKIEADPRLKKLLPYQDKVIAKASQVAGEAATLTSKALGRFAIGTAQFFLQLGILLFAIFTFLISGRAILDAVLNKTPLSETDKSRLLGTFTSVGRATLKGKLIIGIVQGSLAGLALWAAGIDGAPFWGALMMILSIIPAVGTAVVWVPAVVYLVLNGQIGAAIGVALWCSLVVGTADNVLTPLLVGKDTQMPALLVMLTTLGGLAAFGIAGILIGPIIGALFIAVWELWSSASDETQRGAA
jgi:predicted PurR-regulated permease PerM